MPSEGLSQKVQVTPFITTNIMKEIMKELARLAVLTVIVMVAFFAFMVLVAIMIEGAEFLPKYIGGFGTFMIYVAGFMLMFAGIKYFADRNER